MQNSGGVRKFFSVFSWGTKIFCLNFMGYEIFFGILEFHSAPVPGIKTDRSLRKKLAPPYLQKKMKWIMFAAKCKVSHKIDGI